MFPSNIVTVIIDYNTSKQNKILKPEFTSVKIMNRIWSRDYPGYTEIWSIEYSCKNSYRFKELKSFYDSWS